MSESPLEIKGFQSLKLEDKARLAPFFGGEGILASELTFTNLFIWRGYYRPVWRIEAEALMIVLRPQGALPFGLRPLGKADPGVAAESLLLAMSQAGVRPRLCRVEREFAHKHLDPKRFRMEPDRGQYDYVYLAEELIRLPGRRFHRKKNHFNKFVKTGGFEYHQMDHQCVESMLDMQEAWCRLRDCRSDSGLRNEDQAIFEALSNFDDLDYAGGAISINGKVEAFSLGEALNPETAVIHIEKANPEIAGLYAAINQMFCENAWAKMEFINREQDLALESLRAAKKSYNPHHMVEKYTIIPTYL